MMMSSVDYVMVVPHPQYNAHEVPVGHRDMTKDDMIGLIDQSYFVLPPKRQLWYKAVNEYFNGQ